VLQESVGLDPLLLCKAPPEDWARFTQCNGVDYGGGCTIEETGYHYRGKWGKWHCWWHTKNQAWNTTPATNYYQLALRFGLLPHHLDHKADWCVPRGIDRPRPREMPYGAETNPWMFSKEGYGGPGWCGGAPFESGVFVCLANGTS